MTPDVVVLNSNVHGMSVDDYAVELAERLPASWEVAVARTAAERREMLPSARVVTGLEFTEGQVQAAENLELFVCMFAGTDHLPIEAFRERDVAVASASGVHAPNVAEHAIGMVLSFVRGLDRAREQGERREWHHFQVGELQGSTATVVGLGPIGTAIAERLNAFGVETIGVRYTPAKGGPTDEVIGYDTAAFHEALARTDHLILACPLTDVTRRLVGAEEFATLPPHAFLVNVARGEVVDTDALVEAVRGNGIDGAALDVTDPEPLPEDHVLWNFDDVLVTPHNAGHTPKYWDRLTDIAVEHVATLLADGGD